MTPYAKTEIAVISIVGAALAVLLGIWYGWAALVPAVPALALLSFYRDPPRRVPAGGDLVLAAADGRVVEIARSVPGPDGRPMLKIMVFLSVFNVHINRSPCAGRVRDVQYRPGEFRNALSSAADTCNESNTVVIDPAAPLPGPVVMRQIAGVLARRIVCAVRPDQAVAAGQRVGMIKLGSRTEVLVPESPDWDVCVRVGQGVKAGQTVLARLRPTDRH